MNKNISILLLSVGRKSTLILGFQKAFKSLNLNGRVIGVDMDKYAVGLQLVDKGYVIPRHNDKNFLDNLMKIIKEENIDIVIPTSDHDLEWWTNNSNKTLNSNVNYLFSSCESIEITQNKELFLKKLNDSGINSPKIIDPGNINEKLKFPIFINNKFGSNSKFSQIIYTLDQYNFIKKQIPNSFITEYIQGEEFSIDCFINKKKEIVSIVPRTRKYVFEGESFISITKNNKTIIKETEKLLKLFNFIGPINIQSFLTNKNEVYFFEINARFGGASCLSWEAGATTLIDIIKEQIGENINPKIGNFKNNYCMLRYKKDLFFDEDKL